MNNRRFIGKAILGGDSLHICLSIAEIALVAIVRYGIGIGARRVERGMTR